MSFFNTNPDYNARVDAYELSEEDGNSLYDGIYNVILNNRVTVYFLLNEYSEIDLTTIKAPSKITSKENASLDILSAKDYCVVATHDANLVGTVVMYDRDRSIELTKKDKLYPLHLFYISQGDADVFRKEFNRFREDNGERLSELGHFKFISFLLKRFVEYPNLEELDRNQLGR